jgi:hypothetical protein
MSIIDSIQGELDRAFLADVVGQHVDYRLIGHGYFLTGDTVNFAIGLNVPSDADFVAKRFNLYVAARLLDQSASYSDSTERTFRPATWTTVGLVPSNVHGSETVGDAACEFSIEDTWNGKYNNSPISVGSAYSAKFGAGLLSGPPLWTGYPSGMYFDAPQTIRRGSTVTVNVQPTWSRTSNALIKTQFRVTAVMWGSKTVRGPA